MLIVILDQPQYLPIFICLTSPCASHDMNHRISNRTLRDWDLVRFLGEKRPSVKCFHPTTFANPDSVQCSIQCIQRIEQGFGLSLSAIPPQALCHRVQGLD